MSLDLFQDETQQAIDRLPAASTASLEAPFFHSFLPGSMRVMAAEMAKVGRSVSMAASVPMILADAAMGGTELQDRFFQQHDEVFGSAVKYWTPQPGEVGFAGEVVGSLAGMLPTIMANPALAVGSQVMSQAEDLVEKGVRPAKAIGVGVVQGAGLATGIWMPILGQNLWQRVVLGGAGFNVLQGVTTRAGSQLILEGEKAAEMFPTFDAKMLTLDLLLGMAFGGAAHLSPAMREQGKDVWARIANWAENLTPEQVDAIAAVRQAEHMNVETAPGILRTPADVEANVNRVKSALESLLRDEAPQVDTMPKPSLEPDTARQVDAEARVGELREDVARVVAEEGLPELQPAAEPVVRGMPEGWAEMAKLPPEEQPAAIGGAMDRMLASEAADPSPARARAATEAEGAPAPTGRAVPPPPRGEGGEARATPEAPEEPDPWLTVADAKAARAEPPALGLENEDVRAILLVMAEAESGWAEIGGRHLGGETGQPNFSSWVPRADWWPKREGRLNEAQTKEAVRKALAGEPLKKKEQLAIDYMTKIAAERAADVAVVGKDEWDLTAEAVHAEDMEPTARNVVDAALVARAMEISEGAVERLAVMYESDDAGFMAAVRRMIDAHHEESRRIRQDLEAARSRAPAGGQQPGPAGAGPEGAAAPADAGGRAAGSDTGRPAGEPQGPAAVAGEGAKPDPLRQAAEDVVAANPGRHLMVGTNEDGTPRYVTAEEYLAEARAQAELARQDVGLFEVAARCMLGGS